METQVKEQGRTFDEDELARQIGMMTIFSVSGGRMIVEKTSDGRETEAIELPVGKGYRVRVELDFMDTWTVKRVHYRKGVGTVKGVMRDVYCDYVSGVVYDASLFISKPNWGKE